MAKKKISTKKNPKPSKAAMAAAQAMLAPLDLLRAAVRQGEMNAELLVNLNDRIEKLAAQLDLLQKIAPADSKLLTEPKAAPALSLLTEGPHQ